jgi:hypothetical protein
MVVILPARFVDARIACAVGRMSPPILKMPSTQRRKEAKAQSIFVVMGVCHHVQLT